MTNARVSITPADAWADQRLTPLQCRLLGLIGTYVGKDHRAWPSQRTLATQLGVTRKAINDGVKALKKYGYIEVEKRTREDGGQTSNCYLVLMDPLSRQGDTPCNPAVTPPVTLGVTPPVTPEGDTHKKDPIERPNEDTVTFEDAWKAYNLSPKKARQKKKPARDAWARAIKKADPETILKAIEQEVQDRINPRGWNGSLQDMKRWIRDEGWMTLEPHSSPEKQKSQIDWQKAGRQFVELGIWPITLGPRPNQPTCEAPEEVLRFIAREALAQGNMSMIHPKWLEAPHE